jgi:hypothetical protein
LADMVAELDQARVLADRVLGPSRARSGVRQKPAA